MADLILVEGHTATGKSFSIRNCDPKSTAVINGDMKRLPFSGANEFKKVMKPDGVTQSIKGNMVYANRMLNPTKNISSVKQELKQPRYQKPGIYEYIRLYHDVRPEIKVVLIDTISHAMLESVMRDLYMDDWSKFKVFAEEFYEIVQMIKKLPREDFMVIIYAHVEYEKDDDDNLVAQFKIPAGKFTREAIVPESHFTTVLHSDVLPTEDGPEYIFWTQNVNGKTTAKSPAGMFPDVKIPNDIDYAIKCYYAFYEGEDIPDQQEKEPKAKTENKKKTDQKKQEEKEEPVDDESF